MSFVNETELEFQDVSTEQWREYIFADGCVVHIDSPVRLHAGDNGHRIFDANGVSHYIPKKWIHLRWKAEEGAPNFVK